MYPFLRRLRNTFDYSEYGGAPLLGINGVCIICHGGSSSKAIKQALNVAREMAYRQINQKIEAELLSGQNENQISVKYNMNGMSNNQNGEKEKDAEEVK